MYFDHHLCFFQLDVENKKQLFEKMAGKLLDGGFVKDNYLEGIVAREEEYPTAIMVNDTGFAIPHTDSVRVNQSQVCFASLKNPIEFCDMTDKEKKVSVSLVFMLAMSQPHEQLETLQNMVALFQNTKAVEQLKACRDEETFAKILEEAHVY